MPFVVGETIGPYRLMEQLGQGGMATVFKAYHASLDRYVAIKVLHVAFLDDPNFLARFRREARVVARLDHPNIVPIYDFAEHEGRPYLVMKFIEGETLKARMGKGRLSMPEIVRIVEQVGDALAYAHQQGVLHRDIKPSNVLMTHDGQLYLTDFGLARMAQTGESSLTADRMVGTPQYMSPEQALSQPDLDARSDIYSFGVMMYEMLVGRVPYNADTPFAIIHDHIYTPLPMPRKVNPNLSEEVERVLLKALAKNPQDRFTDVPGLVKAFQAATAQLPTLQLAQPELAEESVIAQPVREPPVSSEGRANEGVALRLETETVQEEESAPAMRKVGNRMALIVGLAVVGLIGIAFCALVGLRLLRGQIGKSLAKATQAYPEATPLPTNTFQLMAAAPLPVDTPTVQAAAPLPEDPFRLVELAAGAWENNNPGNATELVLTARKKAGDAPEFYMKAVQTLSDRQDWLLAAILVLDGRRAIEDLKLPPGLIERMHEVVYKAARDPRAGGFFQRNQGIFFLSVAAVRNDLYFGDRDRARQSFNKLRDNQAIKEGFPELRLLEVELAIQFKDIQLARDLLGNLVADSQHLPPWIIQQADELAKIINP